MTWFLVVILAITGQRIALPTESEAACKTYLAAFISGQANVIRLEGGIVLPIVKPVGCMTKEQIASGEGRGA